MHDDTLANDHATDPFDESRDGRDPRHVVAAAAAEMREVLDAIEDQQSYRQHEGAGELGDALASEAMADQGDLLARGRAAYRAAKDAIEPGDDARSESDVIGRLMTIPADVRNNTGLAADAALIRAVGIGLNPEEADRRLPATLNSVAPALPTPILSIGRPSGNRDGAILTAGAVAVLAGAGGAAKTAAALHLAIDAAGASRVAADVPALGGALVVHGGPVVYATYEDHLGILQWRAARLIEALDRGNDALGHVHVLSMAGRPLYGAPARFEPPGPLPGWSDLWDAVRKTEARLVIVDPALAAFEGEQNDAMHVRAFVGHLTKEAAECGAGVLLLAHSNKAARGKDTSVFDAGMVSGSSHWHDAARGAMTLTRAPDGGHVLAISKSNYGPSFRHCKLRAVTPTGGGGAVVGMTPTGGGWQEGEPAKPRKQNGTEPEPPVPRPAEPPEAA